ncbi:NADP(H)-dependent aldo-keto reductase [Celerinatantimonas diazotrophica]|uniref:Protein tas n=1 Tax=Celerinatantimonas diazotrophica TaxID=412034 RepID=A0A4R1J9L7_9GAMM|nr:NADP(H)-dependent aldo-keto reductase [Celerinatantimonas diazotrophica]TCK47306.1 aryl-alcohol dehydrogenase-like predicted oxidoreductase [Celerinatantimonas diazotrophica]CAG9296079.1 Protein tas [Celerinatantimonas diazotrophica]
MQYHKIPHSSLEVSKICLGTMTWGKQNSESDAHQQLDYSLSQGINFIDTAEMYPVPPEGETQGLTEQYIGTWLAKTGNREKVILASKVAGPNRTNHIRENMHLDRRNIREAVHSSLERLQTDYLDLYQLHWPDRNANFFGKLGYKIDQDESYTPIIETLEALGELVKEGKIRYIGVSNETAWGVSQYLRLAEKHELPRIVTIQNPYNLLNRSFETALAEFSHREGVELLAYSPLAFGMLSGKYSNEQWPEGARLTLFKRFSRYLNPQGKAATQAYCDLAQKHGLEPSQMALAYVNSRPFVASNIIGATSMEQLKSNIASFELELDEEVLEQIETIHHQFTYPCP